MSIPTVVIVGRPNVGKSTLFNYLAGQRISIVDDTPGITRDRIYARSEWRGRPFTIIDTGGIEPFTKDNIIEQMRLQAEIAIDMADVIIFMVDLRAGMTSADMEVANLLRKADKPIVLTVNKVDNIGESPLELFEFYNLGMGDVIPISSTNALGIGDLLDEVYKCFPEIYSDSEDEDIIKVAVIGKPNSGKSSLVNKILKEERVIVSDIPGTTRDAVDTPFIKGEQNYIFIDTAGLRRKSRITENIERYSTLRSLTAIERADVCIILIDAQEGATEQDTKIAGYVHENGKASIIAVNKWDLLDKETGTLEKYRKDIMEKFSFMDYAPVVFISAKTGQRVDRLFELIDFSFEQACFRVSTGMLNDVINDAVAVAQPPSDKGKRLKLYYITQTGIKPPTFVLFINDSELMHFSYLRYIENSLRKTFGYEGTPIKIITREKGEKEDF